MTRQFGFDVFLSHNSRDKPRIRRIAQRLKDAGLRVWLDEESVAPGQDIYLAVQQGLESARTLVLFLSPAALGSDWVGLEQNTTLFRDPTNRDRRFLPVLLEDCELPDTLRRYKYIDLRSDSEEAFAALLAALKGEVPPAPPEPKLTTPPRPPGSRSTPGGKPLRLALLSLAGLVSALLLVWMLVVKAAPEPFSLMVYVHGEGGRQDLPLRNQGAVLLDLGPDRRRQPIGDKGEAYFTGIPAHFRDQTVPIGLEAEGFVPAKGLTDPRLDGAELYLAVERLPVVLRGRVQDAEGEPIRGAALRLGDRQTDSKADGTFVLEIPGQLATDTLTLHASAPGYESWRSEVVAGSNEVGVVLTRARP